MQETKRDIKSMTVEELTAAMKESGFPAHSPIFVP